MKVQPFRGDISLVVLVGLCRMTTVGVQEPLVTAQSLSIQIPPVPSPAYQSLWGLGGGGFVGYQRIVP